MGDASGREDTPSGLDPPRIPAPLGQAPAELTARSRGVAARARGKVRPGPRRLAALSRCITVMDPDGGSADNDGGSGHPVRRLGHAPLAALAPQLRQAPHRHHRRRVALPADAARASRPRAPSASRSSSPARRGASSPATRPRRSASTIELVLEPMARDTLPAVTLGALLAARRDPAAVAFVLPSDHLIPDPCAFGDAAAAAAEAAEDGDFVVLGLAPTRPASGYGYIRPGEGSPTGARQVAAFVEKPDVEAGGGADRRGLPVERRHVLLPRRRRARRDRPARAGDPRRRRGGARARPARISARSGSARATPGPRRSSFDYAVMERTKKAAVVPVGFDWSDIGDWREVWALSPKDANGVAAEGPTALIDVESSYIRADKRLIARDRGQGPRRRRHAGRAAHQPHRPHPGGEVAGRPASRPRGGPRPTRRRRCAGRGAGTRPWTSATASG